MLAVGALGCAFKGNNPQVRLEAVDDWQPRPVRLRVYPATRFVQVDGSSRLDARIELMDQMDDSVKGAGQFRVELYPRAGNRDRDDAAPLYVWQVAVRTLDAQRQFYDPITQSYRFQLAIDDPNHSRQDMLLRAILYTSDGRRLQNEAVVAAIR